MSDDEMADAIRRSPRKTAEGQPVMPAVAAKNILQNKNTKKQPNVMLQKNCQLKQKPHPKKRVRIHP